MRMTYDIPCKGMFHSDCEKIRSGIMKDLNQKRPDHDGTTLHAYKCLNCHKIGWYGIQDKTRIIIVKGEEDESIEEIKEEPKDIEITIVLPDGSKKQMPATIYVKDGVYMLKSEINFKLLQRKL